MNTTAEKTTGSKFDAWLEKSIERLSDYNTGKFSRWRYVTAFLAAVLWGLGMFWGSLSSQIEEINNDFYDEKEFAPIEEYILRVMDMFPEQVADARKTGRIDWFEHEIRLHCGLTADWYRFEDRAKALILGR